MVQKQSIIWPEWRIKLLKQLDLILILFEFVLSVIFISLAYIIKNIYFRGVGIGLLIAWVTSAIAYLFKKKAPKSAY
ncbi:hypothetical protein M1558_00930 [Candidatus Parvarchaeota archaeon]|nr:hypothetical protein [Candidatus Parvarchaeota archaeon]